VIIYLAGPLFSESERHWLRALKTRIEALGRERNRDLRVIWPYELVTREEAEALGEKSKFEIFFRCRSELERAGIVIAVLDGPQVDDGTAWEIGYFYRNRPAHSLIIGIRTDFRKAGESGSSIVNAMIECSCDLLVKSSEELMEALSRQLDDARCTNNNEERTTKDEAGTGAH
jgi:nucleoside 2-deoxyribosyltransferase